MSSKIYWKLLVLFGVLFQEIIATIPEKGIDESSELLIRQKRVINRLPGGDVRQSIRNVPYIVSIRRLRSEDHCIGVILTKHIVLTVAKCVGVQAPGALKVYSGNAQIVRGGRSIIHNIIEKKILLKDHEFRRTDGIALITVSPPFIYSANTYNIEFYEGPVNPGLNAMVSGWGWNPSEHRGTEHPNHLRSINVPIISNHDCSMLYLNTLPILESDICTLDASGHQYCSIGDAGAPLVVEANYRYYLVGVHLWNGAVVGRSNPDVFVNLQNHRFKSWIVQNIRIMHANINVSN